MPTDIVSLPSISDARLPEIYERAKEALAQCSRIDECQEWANKAEALASYAKQAHDDQLRRFADRIQARAIRRCGELLKTFDGRGRPPEIREGNLPNLSQQQMAEDAGLSEHQSKTAVRVANVPVDEFEAALELEKPPTVSALAEAGKKARPFDFQGRDPQDFASSTDGQSRLHQLAEFAQHIDGSVILRGALPHEKPGIFNDIDVITKWLQRLLCDLKGEC